MDGEKCSVAYSPLGVTRHKSNKFSPKDKSDPVCVSHRLWWWSRNGCATSEDILWKLDALQTFVSDLHWPDEVFSEHLSQRLQTMSNEMVEAAAQRLLYTVSLLPLSLCFHLSRIKLFSFSPLTLGWATGRASGLQKARCWFVGGDDLTGALHDF